MNGRAAAVVDAAARHVDRLGEQYRVDPRFLGGLRIAYALWVLLLPTDYTWVGRVPAAFFDPRTGPIGLLPAPPSYAALVGLQVVQGVLALVLALGWRTRTVSGLLAVVMLVGNGLVYSFGKVDHTILVVLLPVAMAAAGWGERYSLDARARTRPAESSGFAVLLWGMTVGFGFLSAALPKAATGWLDPSRQATRGYLAKMIADPYRVGPVGHWVFQVDSPLLWKALDYGTVVAEGGLLLALLWPALFRLWVLVIIGFHVSVYLTMGISFAHYVFVYLPFLAPLLMAAGRRARAALSGTAGGPVPPAAVPGPQR